MNWTYSRLLDISSGLSGFFVHEIYRMKEIMGRSPVFTLSKFILSYFLKQFLNTLTR